MLETGPYCYILIQKLKTSSVHPCQKIILNSIVHPSILMQRVCLMINDLKAQPVRANYQAAVQTNPSMTAHQKFKDHILI